MIDSSNVNVAFCENINIWNTVGIYEIWPAILNNVIKSIEANETEKGINVTFQYAVCLVMA